MTFVFEGGAFGAAIDRERGITIRHTNRFLDSATSFPYEIVGPDWRFDFEISTVTQTRTFLEGGKEVTRPIDVSAYIVESALIVKTKSLSVDTVKEILKAGLFQLLTYGGYKLRFVPDYKVDFVLNPKELELIRAEVQSGKRNN